jgi:cytochrome c biogenesis protein CcdA
MLFGLILSYASGLITAFAPCVLPMLPVILGGSFSHQTKNNRRVYIIISSLLFSLILFTLLLKASTSLIGINPVVWAIFSGLLISALGLFMLFPLQWAQLITKLGIEHRSQTMLGSAVANNSSTVSAVLTGFALGPVFSSCSPTYAWVIASVLPVDITSGLLYLTAYCAGLASALLVIALLGRKVLLKLTWATNPYGIFQRTVAIIFILVGLGVATGLDKKVQTYLVEKDFLHLQLIEEKLLPAK